MKHTKETMTKKVDGVEEALDLERQKMFYLSSSNEKVMRQFNAAVSKIEGQERFNIKLQEKFDDHEVDTWKRMEFVKVDYDKKLD